MKRVFAIMFALVMCFTFIVDARTIKDFFISEPGEVFNILPQSTRLDMIDYYDAGHKIDVKNSLGGKSTHFNSVNDNHISVQITESNTIDILLLPISKNDSIIVTINTVSLPAKDSQIAIYDTDWNKLDTEKYFKQATIADFVAIPKGDKTKKQTTIGAIDLTLIYYTIAPETNGITAHQSYADYMSNEDYKKVAPYLRDSITYTKKGNILCPLK